MYYYSLTDDFGYIYSIDNCILTYYLTCSLDFALSSLQASGRSRVSYYERLNCSNCTKWNFFKHHLHYDDGIYIMIGKYQLYLEDKKKYELLPMIRFEVNPNKHYEKDSFREVLDFVRLYCTDGSLDKFDFAIDIPVPLDEVQVFGSRKERGLYKGTRYYGQRNKNGYCKIYDKGKERKSADNLTRVEHTCVRKEKLSLEKFFIVDQTVSKDLSALNASRRALVECIMRMRENGVPYDDILDKLDKATRCRLAPYLSGGFVEYEYRLDLLNRLLEKMQDLFHISYTDSDGFMHGIDEPLPFD
jgi:hypothetical protein